MATKISVAGWTKCPYFQQAANVVASLELLFPEQVRAEIVELQDRDAYKAWLPKIHAKLENSEGHTSSPIVWLNDSEYLGGCDSVLEYSRHMFKGQGSFAKPVSLVADKDAEGKDFDFDLIVIGGGSGGLACAKEASKLGAKVALLDFVKPSPQGSSWGLGGTCVNVGCIPKKLFHHAAMSKEFAVDAIDFGWNIDVGSHDWEGLVNNVRNYIKSLNFGYKVQLREYGVKYLNKLGSLVDAHTVLTKDKKGREDTITGARILIAVGGRPKPLSCPGGELAISSDDMFFLNKPPGKTLVVGASYVALECASFLTGFGYDTTVMVRSILLRGFDQQMAEKVGESMEKLGTKFIRGAIPRKLESTEDGKIKVYWDDGEDVFDTVLSAIGRSADTAGLNLESVGLKTNKDGKFVTEHEQTEVPSIFAIGDCEEGMLELTPVAIGLGHNLAARLFGDEKTPLDTNLIPTAIFAGLEYTCVGLSEEDAISQIGEDNLEVYHTHFTPLQWTVPEHREFNQCYVKVLVDTSKNNLVIGIHQISPESSEIVQAYGVSMKLGMTLKDLQGLIGIHPTVGEEICLLTVTKSSGEEAVKSGC
mmetsp:Transcript_9102/g.15991  ORF Transcript_9102/g.15991 Transcript_9102/m.15991 type:complete len:590 (-) Transcript_9102:476-2245(-)